MRYWLAIAAPLLLLGQQPGMRSDSASVEAGRQLYLGACSGCHGATGEGSQGPSLLSGRASRLVDRALFVTIRDGLPGTTMPNFPLADEKLWQITAFVRSLTAPAITANVSGDAAAGRTFFFGAGNCSACHMIRGEGGYLGPDLSNIGADRTLHQLRESIAKPSARIEDGFRAATATLRTGRTVQGVAKNHNNYSVQILDKTGRLHILQRTDLAKFGVFDASPMPPVPNGAAQDNVITFLARQSIREGVAQ